jgi:hypothetical protein
VLAYPSYVEWKPRRLVRTMRAGGVLPEWTGIVRHHRRGEFDAAARRAGLRVVSVQGFGPPFAPKWQLYDVTKP